MFETEQLHPIFKIYFKIYLMFILTISASNNFYTKPSRLSVQANSFSRIGVKVWNAIPQALKNLSKNAFKRKLKQILFNILGSQDSYIDLSEIRQNVKSW